MHRLFNLCTSFSFQFCPFVRFPDFELIDFTGLDHFTATSCASSSSSSSWDFLWDLDAKINYDPISPASLPTIRNIN